MKPKHILAAGTIALAATSILTPSTARADILYVTNNGGSTIEKFTSGGVGSVFASSGLNGPSGLAFDSAGNLYAANYGDNTVEKFTSGVGSVFASSGLNSVYGLAFDSTGNLYAANSGDNTIEMFTPGGVGSVFASSDLNNPQFLAFTNDAGVPLPLANQVPEPASASLIGLGALLLAVRRRSGSRISSTTWRRCG